MKRFVLLLLAAVASTACNDTDGDYPAVLSFATVQFADNAGKDYYFVKDDGITLYPGDKSRIGGYAPEQGERVVVYYNFLKDPATGYDRNIALYAVNDIRMGQTAIVTTQEELDKLGDAKTDYDPYYCQLTEKYINFRIGYYAADPSEHAFTLIRNEVAELASEPTESGYLHLELRHEDNGDHPARAWREWLSFPLDTFRDALEGMKGVVIRIETPGYGTQYIRLEAPAKDI